MYLNHFFLIDCTGEEGVIYNNDTRIVDGNLVVVGTPVVCFFGLYASYCNDGTVGSNVAQTFCRTFGFDGESKRF